MKHQITITVTIPSSRKLNKKQADAVAEGVAGAIVDILDTPGGWLCENDHVNDILRTEDEIIAKVSSVS